MDHLLGQLNNIEMEPPQSSTPEEAMAHIINIEDFCEIPVINVMNVETEESLNPDGKESQESNHGTVIEATVPCQHLIQKYGNSDADILELHALLGDWNLADLFPFFYRKLECIFPFYFLFLNLFIITILGQHLYVGVLKHLTPEMASTFLNQSGIPLGAQIEFNYHWNKWMDSSKTMDVTLV